MILILELPPLPPPPPLFILPAHFPHPPKKGHDVKSIAINFATTLLFLLPFALYLDDEDRSRYYAGIVVAFLALAVFLPPFGWMRPHPYTDLPGNRPLLFRKGN